MLEMTIPGMERLYIEHLVIDFNGTLAQDGLVLEGVRERLASLAERLYLHVITADTFGQARDELAGLPLELVILPDGNQAEAKLAYIQRLNAAQVAAIGNGRNDALMLQAAALGIAVLQGVGTARETFQAAALVTPNILVALDLLVFPQRLTATLRV
jgi:soluble P-type ATPase